jgi:hypothetical protein
LAGVFLGGSFGWWKVGFEYGAARWQAMNMGPTPNLAASLGDDFGFGMTDVVYAINWSHPAIHADITVQHILTSIYLISLALCALGAARQDSRGGRRLLLAMATPWLVMFAFLPQMHERYLVWGAVFTALAAAVSVGSTLLHLLVTFTACVPILMGMPASAGIQQDFPQYRSFLSTANHQLYWVTILLALIFLYLSLTGVPSKKPPETQTIPPPGIA